MNVLLLSGAAKIGSKPILEVVHELSPHGVALHVAMWAPPTQELLDAQPDLVVWGPVPVQLQERHPISGSTDATDFSVSTESEVDESGSPRTAAAAAGGRGSGAARLRAAYRWRVLRLRKALRPYYGPLRAKATAPVRRLYPLRAWRRVRRDERVMAWARSADLIVAMDSQAVLAAWKLAKTLPDAEVIYGLSAGRGAVVRRLEGAPVS